LHFAGQLWGLGRGILKETMKPIEESPLYRRVRLHAKKRLWHEKYLPPGQYMESLKEFVRLEREMLLRYHEKGDPGWKVCQAYAIMIDVMLTSMLDNTILGWFDHHKRMPVRFAIVANGGYGRGELCPHSDIDFTLLYGGTTFSQFSKAGLEEFKEWITRNVLYPLWDLKFKVGHASRSIKESIDAAREDIQTKTSLMQSRLICGDRKLAENFLKKYQEFLDRENAWEYLQARREDQKERRKKYLDTVFVQEPDIKNGVGGLRDVQNIVWMSIVKYGFKGLVELEKEGLLQKSEHKELQEAYDFLLKVRNELHFRSARPTDVLLLDKQPEVALALGYKQKSIMKRVEVFMRDYYMHARNVFHLSNALEKHFLIPENGVNPDGGFFRYHRLDRKVPPEKLDEFVIKDGVLELENEKLFKKDPVQLVRVFRIAQQYDKKLGAKLIRKIQESKIYLTPNYCTDESACKAFRAILQSGGKVFPTLSFMHDLGILGRFIPEFEDLTCLVQHEYYHRYTADIHTLNTIRTLDDVYNLNDDRHRKFRECLQDTAVPNLLYLILLLHDIGKSKGIKGHAERGVGISEPILERLSIPAPQRKVVLFIIEHHLAMSRFAQKHDVDDPETCQVFANFIQDADMLTYLYVHTYCDTQGTAPGLWTGFKETLLETLYKQTKRLLVEQKALVEFAEEHQRELREEISRLEDLGLPKDAVDGHFVTLPPRYFMNLSVNELTLHLQQVQKFLEHISQNSGKELLMPIIHWEDDKDRGFSVVTVITWDRPGLFYRLAGAFTLTGLNILGTRAFSRADDITIDTFNVVSPKGGAVCDPKVVEQFHAEVRKTLVDLERMLPRIEHRELNPKKSLITKEPEVLDVPFPPRVSIVREESLGLIILEVQAKDSLGLVYKLTRAITHADMDIVFVRLSTENSVAMDTFHIVRKEGDHIIEDWELERLRKILIKIVEGQEGEGVLNLEDDDELLGEGI
jgi:[protein-PII] uridylyltransferase